MNIHSSPSPGLRLGWQESPNERGTTDIVWSCVSALVLCLWTMLHLNVPAEHDNFMTVFWRKARWALLGVLAPEIPMLLASGQLASAQRSVADMRKLGHGEKRWTLSHAFFADSGGYMLQPRDSEPFPITAKQLHYLVSNGYMPLPKETHADIWDKSKGDRIIKGLAFFQAGWLVVNIMARVVECLSITPLEVSALALICSSLTTLCFWWNKPLDVRVPILLDIGASSAEISQEGGVAAMAPFRETPLDFVEGRVYVSSKWSRRLLQMICYVKLQKRPLDRIPNDRDPQEGLKMHCILAIGTAAFATLHFVGWNFDFATAWEKQLWQWSCVAVCCLLGPYGFTEIAICYREQYAVPSLESGGAYKMRWPRCLLFFIPATLYLLARLGLLVGAIASLASLPADAYKTVQWTALIPHI